MNYVRVIPRDLFNEANLLKCLGRLSLLTMDNPNVSMELIGNDFKVFQNEDDGSICVRNIIFLVNGVSYHLFRPLNSREFWPLMLIYPNDDVVIEVFDDIGEFTEDMRELIE